MEILASTISGNTGIGGIFASGVGAQLDLIASTVAENTFGGVLVEQGATAFSFGTVVAANGVADCFIGASSGDFVSLGSNIDSDGTCGLTEPTDLPNTDPMLGPLQDNGGPTLTHALLPGSPAIDAIPVADCTWDDDDDPLTPEVPLIWDQRGVLRPQNTDCDIGAYEVTECADGINNDGDAFIDGADPGCRDGTSVREDPQCQDGINNDPGQDPDPGMIDFDGGLSALGYVVSAPDPQCIDRPWKDKEKKGCGLGFELALLLPGLMWLRRRMGSHR